MIRVRVINEGPGFLRAITPGRTSTIPPCASATFDVQHAEDLKIGPLHADLPIANDRFDVV